MKKINIIFMFLLLVLLVSCVKRTEADVVVTNFELNGGAFYEGEKELFLPVPIKNNQIFTGWEIDDSYYNNPEVPTFEYYPNSFQSSFVISKFKTLFQGSSWNVKPTFHEIRNDMFFTYTYLPNSDSYEISLNQNIINYPRELSIPDSYLDKPVTRVADYGFKGFKHLLIVNLPSTITSIGKEAFKGTSLYKINVPKNIESNAMDDTFYSQGIILTLIDGFKNKKVEVGKQNYFLDCDLKGGKFVQEEFELFIPVPHKNNCTFVSWTVDDKELSSIINMDYGASGMILDLYSYLNYYQGKTLVAKWQEVNFLEYIYLEESDSYAVKGGAGVAYPREITVPDKYNGKQVTIIGDNGFSHLKDLSTIHIPNSIKKIGKGAFSTYPSNKDLKLYEINIPKSLIVIDDYAFANTYINYIELSEGISTIGDLAFSYTFLKEINIPNSLIYLNPSSFRMCQFLEFNISVTNDDYTTTPESGKSMVYSKDENTLLVASPRPDITVPKGVRTIGPNVFAFGVYNNINLPETLTYIDDNAFESAYVRNKIKLPNRLEIIGDYAFYNFNYGGKGFTFPQTIRQIGKYAFAKSNIYHYEFTGDIYLDERIESNLRKIDDYALYELNHSWTDINSDPNKVYQTTIIVPKLVSIIGEYALNWADVIYFEGFVQIDKNFMNNNFSNEKQFNGIRTIYLPEEYFEIMKESILKFSPNVDIIFLDSSKYEQ